MLEEGYVNILDQKVKITYKENQFFNTISIRDTGEYGMRLIDVEKWLLRHPKAYFNLSRYNSITG